MLPIAILIGSGVAMLGGYCVLRSITNKMFEDLSEINRKQGEALAKVRGE